MDGRDLAKFKGQWYDRFDEKRMVVILDEVQLDPESDEFTVDYEIKVRFEVCHTCEGRGKHVNPDIDRHGLTHDDFADDPDFMADYFDGHYDVNCYECGGRRVVPIPISEDDCKIMVRIELEKRQAAQEYAAEMRIDHGPNWDR